MAKTATARYAPVVSALREQIDTGELEPGTWMPSESALMAEHDVSRYSAREALKRLAAEGLIAVVDGKGSYVRNRSPRAARSDIRALWNTPALTSTGKPSKTAKPRVVDAETTTTEVTTRETGWQQADTDLALTLGVPEHTPVFVAERQYPAANTTGATVLYRLYIPATTASRIPALADDPDRRPDHLYALLDRETSKTRRATNAQESLHWTETVRAIAPNADDATTLGLRPGSILLVTRRATHDADGQVLIAEETRRDASNTQLSYTLTPTEPPATARI